MQNFLHLIQSVSRFFYLFISRIEKNSETEKSRWNETREKHCTGEPSVDSMFVLQLREQRRFFFKQNRGGRANLANRRKFDCLGRELVRIFPPESENKQWFALEEDNFANKSQRYYIHIRYIANQKSNCAFFILNILLENCIFYHFSCYKYI